MIVRLLVELLERKVKIPAAAGRHDWIDCLALGSVIDHEGPLPPSSSGSAVMKRPRDVADRSRELRDLRRLDRDGFLRETFTLPVEDARDFLKHSPPAVERYQDSDDCEPDCVGSVLFLRAAIRGDKIVQRPDRTLLVPRDWPAHLPPLM